MTWVLGTGRTGTSLLYEILRHLEPQLVCFQEPAPGPILHFYSKLRSEGFAAPWFDRMIFDHLRDSRERLFRRHRTAAQYVEINPFLFGLGDLLQQLFGKLRVIHMTRHPFSFISSSLNFTPFHPAGPMIHTPLWKLNAARVLGMPQLEWKKLKEAEKWAWRWVAINQKILSLRQAGTPYFLLKYEDLTAPVQKREEILASLFRFLELKNEFPHGAGLFEKKYNASENRGLSDPGLKKIILEICAPLLPVLDYEEALDSKA